MPVWSEVCEDTTTLTSAEVPTWTLRAPCCKELAAFVRAFNAPKGSNLPTRRKQLISFVYHRSLSQRRKCTVDFRQQVLRVPTELLRNQLFLSVVDSASLHVRASRLYVWRRTVVLEPSRTLPYRAYMALTEVS